MAHASQLFEVDRFSISQQSVNIAPIMLASG